MKTPQRFLLVFLAVLVACVALALRVRAVHLLPIDYDEDDYLRAGQQYAQAIQSGDWAAFTRLNYRPEHPPLAKIAYGLALVPLPRAAEIPDRPTTAPPAKSLPQPHLEVARLVAAGMGTLEVLLLGLLSPLAGLFLAVETWEIKYTSQVMLEALPSLTSLLMVFAYLRARGKWGFWMVLSALAFGWTVAAKYPYGLVGAAVLGHWLGSTLPPAEARRPAGLWRWVRPALAWAGLAAAVFFLCDPYLWPDPVGRLSSSLLYHGAYAESQAVTQANYPAWQPLAWLLGPVPWHPGVFLISIDLVTALLAIAGLPRLWRRRRVFALWLAIMLAFLLVWRTKWPQYILMLTAPLCLSAAEGFQALVIEQLGGAIRGWFASRLHFNRKSLAGLWKQNLRVLPWLAPGGLALLLLAFFPLLYQVAMAGTDFSVHSFRDGLQGGVFREVWLGITGQVRPLDVQAGRDGSLRPVEQPGVGRGSSTTRTNGTFSMIEVHYTGLNVVGKLLGSLGGDLIAFELLWTLLTVGLQTALGLTVALALNRRGIRFAGFWRAIYILPWAIPEFVGGMIWAAMVEPENGWISLALGKTLNWSSNPNTALAVLVAAALWMGWPFMMLASAAGLKMLPQEIYDAAAIDGAAGWSRFRWVTWPLLLPLLAPAIIIRAIFAFNQFYLFYILHPPYPLVTLSFVSYTFFDPGQGRGAFAVSAAVNLFTVVFLLLLVLYLNRWNHAGTEVSYA